MLQLLIAVAGTIALLIGVVGLWYLGSYLVLAIVSRLFPLRGGRRKP